MNAIFKDLTTDGLEEAEDRLGGYQPLDTGVYTGRITAAYAGQSQGGAHNVTFLVDIDGREYRETIYITNKKGENFFLNKSDNTKKVPLPGFTIVDDICLVTSGKPLAEQATEEKTVKVWDADARRELPKAVPMLTDLLGQEVTLGIGRILENKNEKQGDAYVATAETRESNTIEKVFHTETKMTVSEARSGATEAVFHDTWKERHTGNTRDKREIKDGGNAGSAGRPGTAPKAGAGKAKTSLFG